MHPNPNLSSRTEKLDTHYQVALENNDFYIYHLLVSPGDKKHVCGVWKELDLNLTGIWKMTKGL